MLQNEKKERQWRRLKDWAWPYLEAILVKFLPRIQHLFYPLYTIIEFVYFLLLDKFKPGFVIKYAIIKYGVYDQNERKNKTNGGAAATRCLYTIQREENQSIVLLGRRRRRRRCRRSNKGVIFQNIHRNTQAIYFWLLDQPQTARACPRDTLQLFLDSKLRHTC